MARVSDISGLLTICRKAGKLVLGMDEVKSCCRCGRAVLVLTASDLSEKSLKEISYVCGETKTPVICAGMTLDEIGLSLGKVFGIMAITDQGFAKAAAKKLSAANNIRN